MKLTAKGIGTVAIIGALAAFAGAYWLCGYWQNLSISLASVAMSLGAAVLIVNHFILSSDKKLAAKPLAKLIAPNVHKFHNDLFIQNGRDTFGKEKFESLLGIYAKHKGNPEAFSPEDLKAIYESVKKQKDDVAKVFDLLQEQFKELTIMLGWSFDTKIISGAFEARINYATFKAAAWDDSKESQLIIVEAFMDADSATSLVYDSLLHYLGLKEEDYQGD